MSDEQNRYKQTTFENKYVFVVTIVHAEGSAS